MTATARDLAEMRSNLAGFEKALRDRRDSTQQIAADLGPDAKAFVEGQVSAYRIVLDSLHMWTDGEFGEAAPSKGGAE